MSVRTCPSCGLVNPASAQACDCGYSFVDGTLGESLAERLAARAPAPTASPAPARVSLAARLFILVPVAVVSSLASAYLVHACLHHH